VVLGVLWSWWANRPLTDPPPEHVSRGNAAVICVIAGLLMGLAIALIVTLVAALVPGSREAVDLPGTEQRRAQLGWIEDDEN
jgi:hypothetical protein